jgi:hypothetical protein
VGDLEPASLLTAPHPVGFSYLISQYCVRRPGTGLRSRNRCAFGYPPDSRKLNECERSCASSASSSRGTREHAGGEGFRSEGHRRGVPARSAGSVPCPRRSACRRSQAPVASDPMLRVVAHRSRLLAAISTSPAATLTLKAGFCFWPRPTVSTLGQVALGRSAAAVCADQRR